MAKQYTKKSNEQEVSTATSPYGSHASMISQEWTNKLSDPNSVVLEGEDGFYVTTRDRLDKNGADPSRYALATTRAKKLEDHLLGVKISIVGNKVTLKE